MIETFGGEKHKGDKEYDWKQGAHHTEKALAPLHYSKSAFSPKASTKKMLQLKEFSPVGKEERENKSPE